VGEDPDTDFVTPAKAGVQGPHASCDDRGTMRPCVYILILANRRNGTLYVGVTSDLRRRVSEHKGEVIEGFAKRYGIHTLVYAEFHTTIAEAILREKRIKNWRRAWKIMLIEQSNPAWRDLSNQIG